MMATDGAGGAVDEGKSSLRENLVFYSTAFFCLVAIFSLFVFLFLVPFFIEPALSTIYMEFDPQPVTCQTTEASFHRGLSNCQWSSCREGCTKEVYECWHIRVRYQSAIPVGKADARSVRDRIAQYKASSSASVNITSSPLKSNERMLTVVSNDDMSDEDNSLAKKEEDEGDTYALADGVEEGMHVHEARLQPNVKGCGYPPDLECNNTFAPKYGVVGANFSCYYSLVDPTLAITQLNIDKVRAELIYCLTIPIILFVISVVYLFFAYFKLFEKNATTLALDTSAALDADNEDLDNIEGEQSSPDRRRQFSKGIVRRAKSGGYISTFATSPDKFRGREIGAGLSPKSPRFANRNAVQFSSNAPGKGGMRLSKSLGDTQRTDGGFTAFTSSACQEPLLARERGTCAEPLKPLPTGSRVGSQSVAASSQEPPAHPQRSSSP